MEEYGVGAGGVELAPAFVREVVGGQHAAPVEEEGARRVEGLMGSAGVGWLRTSRRSCGWGGGGLPIYGGSGALDGAAVGFGQLRCSVFYHVKTGKGEGLVDGFGVGGGSKGCICRLPLPSRSVVWCLPLCGLSDVESLPF